MSEYSNFKKDILEAAGEEPIEAIVVSKVPASAPINRWRLIL